MLVGSEGRGEHGLALAHLAVERDVFMNCGISIGFAGHADPLLAILGVRSFEHLLINFKASCFYFEEEEGRLKNIKFKRQIYVQSI